MTLFEETLITERLSDPELETYKKPLIESKDIPTGAYIISVFNGTTNEVISKIITEYLPICGTFDRLNGNLYVINELGSVIVINGSTNQVTGLISNVSGPHGIAFDPLNGYIYLANSGFSDVSVINTTTNRIIASINVGCYPYGVTFDPLNGNIYVTNYENSNVSVINGSTNKVIANVPAGLAPYGAVVDPSNGYVYVTNLFSYNVSVINGLTNKFIKNITVGSDPTEAAFDPLNGNIYVANTCSNNITVINGSTNKVTSSIKVGSDPFGVAFNPLNGYLYVSNVKSDNVSVIDPSKGAVITNISVGSHPYGVVYNSLNGNMYVSNFLSGSISVISINYHPPHKYAVTFAESGLTTGTSWSVSLNGSIESSTGSTIRFYEPNGSYSYTIGSVNGYLTSPLTGTITVSGSNITHQIIFVEVKSSVSEYLVNFTETGLQSGVSWSVTFNDTNKSSTGSTIAFTAPNGTYSYKIESVSGYTISNSSGNINVSGKNLDIAILFTKSVSNNNKTSSSGISTTELYGIAGIITVAIIASAVFLVRRKK